MATSEYTNETQNAQGTQRQDGATGPRYVETASATTNPDNANSGVKPLVIAGVGFLALFLLSLALSSCVSGLPDALALRYDSYGGGGHAINPDAWDEVDNLFDDLDLPKNDLYIY